MRLDPIVAAAGVKLTAHDSIGSTSTEACALALGGERVLAIGGHAAPEAARVITHVLNDGSEKAL